MVRLFSDIFRTLLLSVALFFVVQTLIQNYEVFGASMEPNVISGEHIIVNKAAYMSLDLSKISKIIPFYHPNEGSRFYPFGEPERGNVVVFKSLSPPPSRLIKRIIGLPGDTIEIKAGVLFVNGKRISEPYVRGLNGDEPPVSVPKDQYYMLGDNRGRSNDSRNFGTVHRSQIVGKAWVSYWPLGVLGAVDSFPLHVAADE